MTELTDILGGRVSVAKRYCVGCSGHGFRWTDLDAVNRVPRKVSCRSCGGNPDQPWRIRWDNARGHYYFKHQDTGELRRYRGEGWPDITDQAVLHRVRPRT